MNRQMQAPVSLTDTPEQIATELLEHAIINWRDVRRQRVYFPFLTSKFIENVLQVPSITKLMTMGFIQRANETAEYIANGRNVVNSNDLEQQEEPPNSSQNTEETTLPLPSASVQSPAPALPEAEAAASAAAHAEIEPDLQEEDKAMQDVAVDPTPPQKLEGELAGLEPIYGTTQITLNEAIAAGTTHGGLHFPKDNRLNFSGAVSEMDQKLQLEIAEWHKCMQEHAKNQQNEAAAAAAASNSQQTSTVPQQNGGAQEEENVAPPPASEGATSSTVSPPTSSVASGENEENQKPA